MNASALASGCPGPDPVVDDASATIDAATAHDACVPRSCPVTACGTVDDGCGGSLDCRAGCACDEANLDACPQRACELATGCTAAGECAYEPVTCGFERCECASGTCGDSELRQCGDTCGAEVCDPRPTVSGGRTLFANACVAVAESACGICGLGQSFCDGDSLGCTAPAIPGVSAATANCDGGSPTSSVVYLDPNYSGIGANGSQARPFVTLAEALAAATLREARAVVVGGSPTFEGPLEVAEGVSIVGGYVGWPSWLVSSHRPTFRTTADGVGAPLRRVGLIADRIATPTLIQRVAIVTTDTASFGTSNAGILVADSPALILRDVTVTVGAAGDGAPGEPGAAFDLTPTLAAAIDGAPGSPAPVIGCPTTVVIAGGAAGSDCGGAGTAAADGQGGSTTASGNNIGGNRGEAAFDGALGGVIGAPGQPGAAHSSAATNGSHGVAGLSLGAASFPELTGAGLAGASGTRGRAGGGGGSGLGSYLCGGSASLAGPGGGGGCGGYGGHAGAGGGAGGWAFGVVLVRSGADGASPGVTLDRVSVVLGAAGVGGEGGAGAAGSRGGIGGVGGTSRSTAGGAGGNGSDGQRGGDGGDGSAGSRTGIYCDAPLPTAALEGVTLTGDEDARQQGCE